MKKNLLLRICLAFLICASLNDQNAYAQEVELITPLSLNSLALTGKAQSAISRVQSNSSYRNIQYIKIGDLTKIQKNGILKFTLPGVPEQIVASAARVTVTSENNYDWYGELSDGVGYMNVLCRQGEYTANIFVNGNLYEIYHIDGDTHVLLNTFIDPSKSDCATEGSTKSPVKGIIPNGGRANYESECVSYVRVLVLYTPAAASAVANINQTINMCISNFNNTVYSSGITSRIVVELAGQAEYNFSETSNIGNDLTTLRTDPTISNLRNNVTHADLVVLLTNGSMYSAYGVAATLDLVATDAYAIVQAPEAVSNRQTFSHEVGHLYSLRHDVDPGPSPEWRQYAHGYVFYVNPFQACATIMVSAVNVPNSTRLLRFSNPNQTYSGAVTGTTANHDNARRISETYNTVNNFTSDVFRPFNALVSGPANGLSREWYTWEAGMTCGSAPYTYEWRTSYDGFNFSSIKGTNETFTENLPCPDGNYYFIKVTVHSGGQTSSGVKSVYLDKQRCNSFSSRIAAANLGDSGGDKAELYELMPNPVGNSADFRYYIPQAQSVKLKLINTQGQLLNVLVDGSKEAGTHTKHFNTANLPAGLYFYRLETDNASFTKRMVVIR